MKKLLQIIIIILLIIPIFFGIILLFHNSNIYYSKKIEVGVPIHKVDSIFENIYNMKYYMPETKSIKLINGKDNIEGSEYEITIIVDSDSMKMTGMLIKNDLPNNLIMQYEVLGMTNTMTQKHQKMSEEKTLIIHKQKFEFKGLLKIITFFVPSRFNQETFQKQSDLYLNSFKKFLENNH